MSTLIIRYQRPDGKTVVVSGVTKVTTDTFRAEGSKVRYMASDGLEYKDDVSVGTVHTESGVELFQLNYPKERTHSHVPNRPPVIKSE